SIDSILDKTHLRTIHDYLIASRRAIGDTILKIESVEIQKILDPIKEDILKRKRLTRENFKNIAKNLEFSFINFLVHTRNRLNAHYRRILVNDATSTVRLFDKIRREIPADSPLANNAVFNMLSYEIGDNMSGTKLISLFGKISDALTANTLTE